MDACNEGMRKESGNTHQAALGAFGIPAGH